MQGEIPGRWEILSITNRRPFRGYVKIPESANFMGEIIFLA